MHLYCTAFSWVILLDTLTALGTIGACVIALALALKANSQKLDCVFVWGTPNNYQPTLVVNNLGDRTVVISGIDVTYNRQHLAYIDFWLDPMMRDCTIIPPRTEKIITLDSGAFQVSPNGEDIKKKQLLTITVKTISGKKFKSKQKYSREELLEVFFGEGLFAEN